MTSETGLKIRLYGDPALRRRAKPVARLTREHGQALSRMAQAMYAGSGIGLAAPQVGLNWAMIVADAGSGLYKLVNPKVVKGSGSQSFDEGCLSIPGVCVRIKRPRKVVVQALDENGAQLRVEAEGLLATVLQHEIDHLKGRLIVDYASLWKRMQIKKRLDELKARFKSETMPEQGSQFCQLQL